MRILIATDLILSPHMRELGRGYAACGCDVVFGVDNFWAPYFQCDILHLHWPEMLFNQLLGPPNEAALMRLGERLENWKKRVPIIATVHNLHPHQSDSSGYREAYRLVYEAADLLVHHGDSSIKIITEQYPNLIEKSMVAPIGHYACLDCGLSREEARTQLGLDDNRTIILSAGTVRSRGEFWFLIRGYLGARAPSKQLMVVGYIPFGRFSKMLIPFFKPGGINLYPGFLPDEELARFVAAADVVLVVRRRILNSGAVTMGLSLGKVVVGPSFGVPGEVLTSFENPVYDPQSHRSVSRALERGVELAATGLGEKNRKRALAEWRWEDIAKKLLDAVQEVGRKRPRQS